MRIIAYTVFISHTHKDEDLARDVTRRLEESGIEVPSTVRSEDTDKSIVTFQGGRPLRKSDEVAILLTDYAVNSPAIVSEAGAAWGLRKRITLVLVGSPEVPKVFRSFPLVKYSELPSFIADVQKRAQQRKQSRSAPRTTIERAKRVKRARSASAR